MSLRALRCRLVDAHIDHSATRSRSCGCGVAAIVLEQQPRTARRAPGALGVGLTTALTTGWQAASARPISTRQMRTRPVRPPGSRGWGRTLPLDSRLDTSAFGTILVLSMVRVKSVHAPPLATVADAAGRSVTLPLPEAASSRPDLPKSQRRQRWLRHRRSHVPGQLDRRR